MKAALQGSYPRGGHVLWNLPPKSNAVKIKVTQMSEGSIEAAPSLQRTLVK
jgi:hypothetical protein